MNDIRNTMSAPNAFSSLQVAMQRLYDLLASHRGGHSDFSDQSDVIMSVRNQQSAIGGGGGNRHRGGPSNRGHRGGGRGGFGNSTTSSSSVSKGLSSPPVCHECGQPGHFRPGCPKLAKRNKRSANGGDHVNRLARTDNNQTPSGHVSNASSINKHSSTYLLFWILDSGATRHCSYNRDLFINYKLFGENHFVLVASGQVLKVLGIGDINLALPNGGVLNIKGVWHVPDLKENVLSIFRLAIVDFSIVFFSDKARVYDMNNKCLFTIRAQQMFVYWPMY